MIWQDVLAVGASVIASLGGAGIIIFALSGWLGKVWAERIMETERASHAEKLEKLRAELQQKNQADIEAIKADLNSNHQRKLTSFHERLAIYKVVIDLFADFLFDLQVYYTSNQKIEIPQEKFLSFEKLRMRTYGYLSVLASQEVMDSHEEMVECIFDTLEGKNDFSWSEIRSQCLVFLNAARKDLEIDENEIEYRGNR